MGIRQVLGVATWWSLIVELLIGAVAYVASAFIVAGPQARDFLNLLRNVVRRRRGSATPAEG